MKNKSSLVATFVKHFCKIATVGEGVQLLKTKYIQEYGGATFTITLQKGDKLNRRKSK
jgi:hypothetical protein